MITNGGHPIGVRDHIDQALEIQEILRDSPWTKIELHWELIKPATAGYPYGYDTFCRMIKRPVKLAKAMEENPRLYPAIKKILTDQNPTRSR